MAENEILKDLFFIERGFLNGNHFVYRSDTPVLIDTGYISGFEETEKSITQLGVNLPDISLIINTHTHCDHIGGNNRIQQKSGCDIALHMDTYWFKETVDLYFKGQYQAKYDEVMNSFLGRGIIKQENNDLYTTVKP